MWDPETDAVYLPKTGLSLEGDRLIKVSSKGEVMGRFALSELHDIQAISTIDSFSLVFAVVTFIAAVACKILIESLFWGWLLFILLGCVSLIFSFAVKRPQILLVFQEGEVRYDVLDLLQEARGFVITVRERRKLDAPADSEQEYHFRKPEE